MLAASGPPASLRGAIPKRNLRPAFIHSHRPSFVQKIETVTAPKPFLRRACQTPLHRIALHIPQLLPALLRPHVEVVGPACQKGVHTYPVNPASGEGAFCRL